MIRLTRRNRRIDQWASPHERARARAAQRLDWPLDAAESEWLDRHLAECTTCRALATDYVDIRNRLRALRGVSPPPPRDLWARTAAAIEQESRRGRPARSNGSGRLPLGALSGVLVIAVVLGATLLSTLPRRDVVSPTASTAELFATQPVAIVSPAGTPLSVGAGDVRMIRPGLDGSYHFSWVGVDEVCPANAGAECPTVRDADATALAIAADPQTIIGSPEENRAVVVGAADDSNANHVIVMTLPEAAPSIVHTATPGVETPPPAPSPVVESPTPSAAPTSEPPPASTPPGGTPSGEPSSDPSTVPSEAPSSAPSDLPSVAPSDDPASATPSAAPPSVQPSPDPTPTPEAIAIASNLIVVGQTAAFSPDGESFAFTGRPADDSTGPDIYLWQVGDEVARPVTSDHRSVFASWADGLIVGSRPSEAPAEGPGAAPEAFLIDPSSGAETELPEGGWRPIVAPTGDRALVVRGTVTTSDEGRELHALDGTLELRTWDPALGAQADGGTVVIEMAGPTLDARWDETGSAFAVWVEDAADPSFGRLSLYFVNPETGELEQPEAAPRDEPALPGFSIGDGRLAWATPAGQGGEGSRVLIVAWGDDGVGTIETAPGEQAVVVR